MKMNPPQEVFFIRRTPVSQHLHWTDYFESGLIFPAGNHNVLGIQPAHFHVDKGFAVFEADRAETGGCR